MKYVCSYSDCSLFGIERAAKEDSPDESRICSGQEEDGLTCGRLFDVITEEGTVVHVDSERPPPPVPPTPPTPKQLAASQLQSARMQRNQLLSATDWTQLLDVQEYLTDKEKEEAREYRRALRDTTKTLPETPDWILTRS